MPRRGVSQGLRSLSNTFSMSFLLYISRLQIPGVMSCLWYSPRPQRVLLPLGYNVRVYQVNAGEGRPRMPSCAETSCDLESEWPCADPREQALLMLSGVAFVVSGARAVLRNRPRWFPVWLGGLLAWATIPKYFICARCENYDKPCDFFYGGKYAAKLFKKQDKPFNAFGYAAEGSTLGVFQFLPVIAARRDFKALAFYGIAAALFQSALVKFCCIDCVRYAQDP